MKTIKDLKFKHKPGGGLQAKLYFNNKYGVSVLFGKNFYSNGRDTYDLGIIGKNGKLDYSTSITSDVLGYLTADKVSEIMKKIQELK